MPDLIAAAEDDDSLEARGLALRDGKLFAVVVVPLLAPEPIAYICLGFRIDDAFAAQLGSLTHLDVSFLNQNGAPSAWTILASTFDSSNRQRLLASLRSGKENDKVAIVPLRKERFVTLIERLDLRNGRAAVALQRNLETELAPFRALEGALLAVGLAGLLLSVLAVIGIASSLSRPILRLAEDARRVEEGDYTPRACMTLDRRDELGQLSRSFQHMTAGLAERDKVRDLLGKVTSPAIAAELTRRKLLLGGEEKKVTIFFSDLRNFTPLSESLPPGELLEVLNAYLTSMSQIVDQHGGVVDKYIGDALMALFGAPLEMPDQAEQALLTALEMRNAMEDLNHRLFQPRGYTIGFGIGIHTGMVVAGNVGSPERYNYSVIGDDVNVASRLQALTRNPDYGTDIIVSDATLRESTGRFQTRMLGEACCERQATACIDPRAPRANVSWRRRDRPSTSGEANFAVANRRPRLENRGSPAGS